MHLGAAIGVPDFFSKKNVIFPIFFGVQYFLIFVSLSLANHKKTQTPGFMYLERTDQWHLVELGCQSHRVECLAPGLPLCPSALCQVVPAAELAPVVKGKKG